MIIMMKKMTLRDAVNAVNGIWYGDEEALDARIESVVIDSRKAAKGTLFVAIPGEKNDGHDFIPQVLESGAVCAVSQKELPENIRPYIKVENTRTALRDLARFYRNLLDIKVVGITGSVGKTSTKEMIGAVLNECFAVQKTAGNFNNEIGLPLTVFSIEEKHEIGILEMGISDFGEMTRLAEIARPDIMVITNIGQCHLENLKTRDGILKAKTECFDYLSEGAAVVLNGTDDKLLTVEQVQGRAPFYFGIKEDLCRAGSFEKVAAQTTYAYADNIKTLGLIGSECTIHMRGKNQPETEIGVKINVAGIHNVYNACAASVVGLLCGMKAEEISCGIAGMQALGGRGKQIRTDRYLLVDDTYNANPVSMRAELDMLKESPGRKIAILGDMFELGEDEVRMHYDLGTYAADCCEVLICIGRLSRNIYDGAVHATEQPGHMLKEILHFGTKEEFLAQKDAILKEGDIVLLKASHGMDFASLLNELK